MKAKVVSMDKGGDYLTIITPPSSVYSKIGVSTHISSQYNTEEIKTEARNLAREIFRKSCGLYWNALAEEVSRLREDGLLEDIY